MPAIKCAEQRLAERHGEVRDRLGLSANREPGSACHPIHLSPQEHRLEHVRIEDRRPIERRIRFGQPAQVEEHLAARVVHGGLVGRELPPALHAGQRRRVLVPARVTAGRDLERRARARIDGQRTLRVAFAGTNDQPYRSVNQWLLAQGVTKINPWPDATKAWAAQNPQRVQQLLWSNPRYVFFREEALSDLDAAFGPKGAQGVPLTPGRSIAVDPGSIPYGTPVYMASRGAAGNLQKLVFAQDTGSAIVGAVRADYFAGTGLEAGLLASRVNQPLRLWALWPK